MRDRVELKLEPTKNEKKLARKQVSLWLKRAAGRTRDSKESDVDGGYEEVASTRETGNSSAAVQAFRRMLAVQDATWDLFKTPVSRKHGSLQFWRGESKQTMAYWTLRSQRLLRELVAEARISARRLVTAAND